MFRTARKALAELARLLLGPSWVEEEYVKGLIRSGKREMELYAQIADQDRTIVLLRARLEDTAKVPQGT